MSNLSVKEKTAMASQKPRKTITSVANAYFNKRGVDRPDAEVQKHIFKETRRKLSTNGVQKLKSLWRLSKGTGRPYGDRMEVLRDRINKIEALLARHAIEIRKLGGKASTPTMVRFPKKNTKKPVKAKAKKKSQPKRKARPTSTTAPEAPLPMAASAACDAEGAYSL